MPREDRSPIFADSMRYLEKRNRGQTKTFVVIVTILVSLFFVVAIAVPMSSGPAYEPSLKAPAPDFNESTEPFRPPGFFEINGSEVHQLRPDAYFSPPAFFEVNGSQVHQIKPYYFAPPSYIEINGSDIKVHNLSSRNYQYKGAEENGDDLWSRLHKLAKVNNEERRYDSYDDEDDENDDEEWRQDDGGRLWRRRKNYDDTEHLWRKKERKSDDDNRSKTKVDDDERKYWNKIRKDDDNRRRSRVNSDDEVDEYWNKGSRSRNDDGDDDEDDDASKYWRRKRNDRSRKYWNEKKKRNENNDEKAKKDDDDNDDDEKWSWLNELDEKDRNDDRKDLLDKYEVFIRQFLNETRAERSTPDEELEKKKNKDIKHYEDENLDEEEVMKKRIERKSFKKGFKDLKIRAVILKKQFRNDGKKVYNTYQNWQEEVIRQVALVVGQYERYDKQDQEEYREWLADLKEWMNNLHRTMKEHNYTRRFTNEYRQKGKNFVDDLEMWKTKWDQRKETSKKTLQRLADDLKKWWNDTNDSATKEKVFDEIIEEFQEYISIRIGDRKIEKKYNEDDGEWYWTDNEEEKEEEDDGDGDEDDDDERKKSEKDKKLDRFEKFVRNFFNRTRDERYDPDYEIEKQKNIERKQYEEEYLDEDEVEKKRRERVFYKKKFKSIRNRGKAMEKQFKDDEKKIYQAYQNWEDNAVKQIAFIIAQYETYDSNDQNAYKQWLADFKVWMDDLHEKLGNENFTRRFTEEYRQKNKNFVDDFEQWKEKWDQKKEASKKTLNKMAEDLKTWWRNKNNTAVRNEVFGKIVKEFQDYIHIRFQYNGKKSENDDLQAPRKQQTDNEGEYDDEDDNNNDDKNKRINPFPPRRRGRTEDFDTKVDSWKKELEDFIEKKLDEWKKNHTTTAKPKTKTETKDQKSENEDYSENYWDMPPRVRKYTFKPRKTKSTTANNDNEEVTYNENTQSPVIVPYYAWDENPKTPNENNNKPTQKNVETVTRPRRDLPIEIITKPPVQPVPRFTRKTTPETTKKTNLRTTDKIATKTTTSTPKQTVFPPSQCPAIPLERSYKVPLASYADMKLYEVARIQSLGIPLPVPSVNVRCCNVYVKVKKSGIQYIPDDAMFYNNWECGSNKNLWNNVSMIATQSTSDWVEKFDNYNMTSDINLSFLFADDDWVLAFECYTDISYPDVAYNIRLFSKGQPRALDAKGTQMLKQAEDAGLNPGSFAMVQVLHTQCDFEEWSF